MSGAKDIRHFSGAMGFLLEIEHEREQEENRKRERAAIQRSINDAYNSGVDDYNRLVDKFNNLNDLYVETEKDRKNYLGIALELAHLYKAKDAKLTSAENELMEAKKRIAALEKQNQVLKSHFDHASDVANKASTQNQQLKMTLKFIQKRCDDQKNEIDLLNVQKKLIAENQEQKLSKIKESFHQISDKSDSDQLQVKLIYTKFKVLKSIILEQIQAGVLNADQVKEIESQLVKEWDKVDMQLNAITASEALAFLMIENPDLIKKLEVI